MVGQIELVTYSITATDPAFYMYFPNQCFVIAEERRSTDWRVLPRHCHRAEAAAWSTAGFFARLSEEDDWTILFRRGFFSGPTFALLVAAQSCGKVIKAHGRFGGMGLLLALVSGLGMIAFPGSLRPMTVADVHVIYATVPFITAGVARLILAERAPLTVLAAVFGHICLEMRKPEAVTAP